MRLLKGFMEHFKTTRAIFHQPWLPLTLSKRSANKTRVRHSCWNLVLASKYCPNPHQIFVIKFRGFKGMSSLSVLVKFCVLEGKCLIIGNQHAIKLFAAWSNWLTLTEGYCGFICSGKDESLLQTYWFYLLSGSQSLGISQSVRLHFLANTSRKLPCGSNR